MTYCMLYQKKGRGGKLSYIIILNYYNNEKH